MRNQTIEIQQLLDILKQETATELGITLGAEQTSRNNGIVGGIMTKKLIELGKIQLQKMTQEQGLTNVELTQFLTTHNDNHIH